ncbi:hypothetical protein MKW98_027519, partial [Papaver atlanticum]
ILDCLAQLYENDITLDYKHELDVALLREGYYLKCNQRSYGCCRFNCLLRIIVLTMIYGKASTTRTTIE